MMLTYHTEHNSLLWEDRKIIMFWTEKAGCTMAVSQFFSEMGILDRALARDQWIHVYRSELFQHEYGKVTTGQLRSGHYYVFKVIRDPYERAVSTYIHLEKTNLIPKTWSFEEYLNQVRRTTYFINGHPLIRSHCRPQYQYDESDYVRRYVKLEKTETLDIVNRETGMKLNFDFNSNSKSNSNSNSQLFPHHQPKSESDSLSSTSSNSTTYLGNLPYSELPTVMPKTYRNFYNQITRAQVEFIYYDDIVKYQYEFYPHYDDKTDLIADKTPYPKVESGSI
jgi:hypothetical protein